MSKSNESKATYEQRAKVFRAFLEIERIDEESLREWCGDFGSGDEDFDQLARFVVFEKNNYDSSYLVSTFDDEAGAAGQVKHLLDEAGEGTDWSPCAVVDLDKGEQRAWKTVVVLDAAICAKCGSGIEDGRCQGCQKAHTVLG